MSSRSATLLRGPEDPQRATFLELFFDLVFVFALFRLSQGLVEHLRWSNALQTLVLLVALWWVWSQTSGTVDRYDPRRPQIQLLFITSMFASFAMAVVAPDAFGKFGLVFAGTYVTVQVGRSLLLVVVTRGKERPELRLLFWFGVSAVPWLAGAAVHGWARGLLWLLAVTVDYAVAGVGWPTPRLGRTKGAELGVSGEFLAERQRQFVIIALGELILATGLAFTSGDFDADRKAAVVVAFATTVLLWRIYIYRAGEALGAVVAAAPDPLRVSLPAVYAHLLMIAGIVAISVGEELVIRQPFGHTPSAWIAVVLGGPALFLAGRGIFEYAVFGWVSLVRVIAVLVIVAIAPAMTAAPPLLVALVAAMVLAGIAVADTVRGRRHPAEPPSPPADSR